MAKSFVFVAVLLFLSMEATLFGTAEALTMGESIRDLAPKLQASGSLSSGLKLDLPAEAHDFISRIRSKIDEDPSILKQPASWDTLVSFVELASARGKAAYKKASYSKKTPVQKIVHHLFEEAADDNDEQTGDDNSLTEKLVGDKPISKSNPIGIVVFFFVTLVLIGGLRYLALFLTQKHKDVDPIDYMIGTNFTTGSLVAGLVAGFSFSFVDSIMLYATMIFMEGLLTKLPGANEENSYAAYANIFSNLVSGAVSASAGSVVSESMNIDQSQATPFWSQLAGALLGGIIGLMLAKLIPHTRRVRGTGEVVSAKADDADDQADMK